MATGEKGDTNNTSEVNRRRRLIPHAKSCLEREQVLLVSIVLVLGARAGKAWTFFAVSLSVDVPTFAGLVKLDCGCLLEVLGRSAGI